MKGGSMAEDYSSRLFRALVYQDPARAIDVIAAAKNGGITQDQLFDQVYAPALSLLGGAWASGAVDEYAFTQSSVVAERIISFALPPMTAEDTGVTILVGTMHHDLHSIDKTIAAAALKEAGHRVIDLGVDVRPADFLSRAEETDAGIVFVFASTAATAASVSRVREMFRAGHRGGVCIFVGGGPFTADTGLARSVGANGVSRGAESALRLVHRVTHPAAAHPAAGES
jgi:5-methyltetrahydrofolate--homocysteine methyltransferase